MVQSHPLLKEFSNANGQGVVEYALLLLLISIVAILMMKGVGGQTSNYYSQVNSALEQR